MTTFFSTKLKSKLKIFEKLDSACQFYFLLLLSEKTIPAGEGDI